MKQKRKFVLNRTTEEALENVSRKKRERLIYNFTLQIKELTKSSINFNDALKIMAELNNNLIAKSIIERINCGKSLSQAINEMKAFFPPLYCGIIKIADKTGNTNKIFERLSFYLSKKKDLISKIKGALIYPCLVLLTALISFTALQIFIFPKIQEMINEFSQSSGEANKIQLVSFNSLLWTIILLLVSACILLLLINESRKRDIVKNFMNKIVLKLPVINKMIMNWHMYNFSFAIEILTSENISLDEALGVSKNVISNNLIKNKIECIRKDISYGESLYDSFAKNNLLSGELLTWIRISSETGNITAAFSKIHEFYEDKINKFISVIIKLIEPVFTLFTGSIMLFFIIKVIIPVLTVMNTIL